MRLVRLSATTAAALGSASAATSPATVEQMVCSPTSMFLGTVMSATAVECRKRAGDECMPEFGAKLKIRIAQVLPGSSDRISVGQVLDAYTHTCAAPPFVVGNKLYQVCGLSDSDVTVRRDNQPVSDADVTKAFTGRRFWFAQWQNGDVLTYTRPERALAIWKDVCPTSPYRQR